MVATTLLCPTANFRQVTFYKTDRAPQAARATSACSNCHKHCWQQAADAPLSQEAAPTRACLTNNNKRWNIQERLEPPGITLKSTSRVIGNQACMQYCKVAAKKRRLQRMLARCLGKRDNRTCKQWHGQPWTYNNCYYCTGYQRHAISPSSPPSSSNVPERMQLNFSVERCTLCWHGRRALQAAVNHNSCRCSSAIQLSVLHHHTRLWIHGPLNCKHCFPTVIPTTVQPPLLCNTCANLTSIKPCLS